MLSEHPSAWLKKVVTIVSPACQSRSPAGIPCGAISGMLRESQKWIVRRMYPVPRSVSEIGDPESKYYSIVRTAITHDVGVITTANPSSVIRIAGSARDHAERLIRDVRDGTCRPPGESPEAAAGLTFRPDPRSARKLERIVKRHGQLLPRHFWHLRFMAHWLGGTLGLYLPRPRELCGDVPIRDIGLLASEGRLSIPLADNTP
ncbi:MAG: GH3 family acyl-acid amido synthetase, partial [Planctomycetota bacterium]